MTTLKPILASLVVLALLTSCDHNVTTETTVFADGRLERTFVFENRDSARNIVGLLPSKGWTKTVSKKAEPDRNSKSEKFIATFKKSFASAEEANSELSADNDSLLRITSAFDKTFRWFYTDI